MKKFIYAIIVLLIFVFGWFFYYQNEVTFCPDREVIDHMPRTMGASPNDSYYVKDNHRVELSILQQKFVKLFCSVEKIEVY